MKSVKKMETIGESRDHSRLEIQCGRWMETTRDKGDCLDYEEL